MARKASDTVGAARRGRTFIREQLEARGARVVEAPHGNVVFLEVRIGDSPVSARVRVKTRQSGTWQTRVSDGTRDPLPTPIPTFWAFVDFMTDPPGVYIAPDAPLREVLHESHQDYLARHGGLRAVNDASDHHALYLERIEHWRDGWDLLGLPSLAADERE